MRFQNYPNIVHKAYECVELFQNGHVKSYLIKCSKCCCARSKLQINLYFSNMSATRHGAKKKLIVQKSADKTKDLFGSDEPAAFKFLLKPLIAIKQRAHSSYDRFGWSSQTDQQQQQRQSLDRWSRRRVHEVNIRAEAWLYFFISLLFVWCGEINREQCAASHVFNV